ncbi:MAG: HDOD domain-containing protein [Sulfuricella sp.]|nr:HDOD domain-containing protein [Sulfuricella sp.]
MEAQNSPLIPRLLQQMETSPGFAGLGAAVHTITKLVEADDVEIRDLVSTILRDAALTAKLLRIANSSRYGQGGRNVSTINQAIAIVGLKTVKSVALSLALLDALSNKPQSRQLQAEIVAAYFCGTLASEITRLNAPRFNAQEAQVCGLMQSIGRMMTLYYLYDEIERIRAIQTEKNLAEEEAVQEVLGSSFAEIGAAIAAHWNLPDVLQQSMAPVVGKAPPQAPATAIGWHQLCTLFARLVTDSLFRLPENREKVDLARNIEFFRVALGLREQEVHEIVEKALADTETLLSDMAFPCNVEDARNLLRKANERVLDVLSGQDTLTKGSDKLFGKKPVEVIQYTLRQIHDTAGFDRTLLMLPEGASGLRAIAGVGRDINHITAKFRCRGGEQDIFRMVMGKKTDFYIADAKLPSIINFIPVWYRELVDAPSFLLLSLVHHDQVVGLVYGDYSEKQMNSPLKAIKERAPNAREDLLGALLAGAAKK